MWLCRIVRYYRGALSLPNGWIGGIVFNRNPVYRSCNHLRRLGGAALILFTLVLIAGAGTKADTPATGHSSCTLIWTAPGDDSLTGQASAYDIRFSVDSTQLASDFEDAETPENFLVPGPAGTEETFTVEDLLSETTYYFAIKAVDDAGNFSTISNIAFYVTDDQFPPAATEDLQAGPGAESGDLDLDWTAVGDDSLWGTADSYIIRICGGPINESNWSQAATVTNPPSPHQAGTLESFTIPNLTPGNLYYVAIKTVDNQGNVSPISNVVHGEAKVELVLDADDKQELPLDFSLAQNYPNPFNPTTTIEYSIPTTSYVRLTVYNIRGQTITTLLEGIKPPGRYEQIWNGTRLGGSQVASGIYFYRLETNQYTETKKMVLLK